MNGMRTFIGNSVGDTATYTCDPGFVLIGIATTTCTAAADGNSAAFPPVPPPECSRVCEYLDWLHMFLVVACLQGRSRL